MGLFDKIKDVVGIGGDIISGVGSVANGVMNKNNAKDNVKYQKEFAQNQIQWRLADARKAGIEPHPLYLLGYNGHQFQNVGGTDNGWADFGQSLSNAADKIPVSDEFQQESARLSLQSQQLENQSKALEVEKQWRELKSMGQSPAFKGLDPFSQPSSTPVSIGNGQAVSSQIAGNVRLGYGFDTPISAYSFSPRPDGTIEVLPSKDRMDWSSESMPVPGFFEGVRQWIDASAIKSHLERKYGRKVYYGVGPFGSLRFSFKKPEFSERPIEYLVDNVPSVYNNIIDSVGNIANYAEYLNRGYEWSGFNPMFDAQIHNRNARKRHREYYRKALNYRGKQW